MDDDRPTSQSAIAFRFICSSDKERYQIITQDLDTLVDFVHNGSDEHINVRYVLAATAYSMFARYILSAHTFMESYRDVHGPDTPSLAGTELDILHRMAGRMGYPADAARRFFDNVVEEQSTIYDNIVWAVPVPDHPPGEGGLSLAERQLSLNQWYSYEYDISTIVPYVPMPAPGCEQCVDAPEPCKIYPGATGRGCAHCTLMSRHCSLLDHGQGNVWQDMQHALRQLSTVVSQVNSTISAANPFPPDTAGLPPSMLPPAPEDV